MLVLRRRLLYWLIKEYIRKWGRSILIFFGIGLVVFFLLVLFLQTFKPRLPTTQKETIGVVGAYTVDNMPFYILTDLSEGLTEIAEDGKPIPAAAKSWKITDNGKTYMFILHTNMYFTDGTNFTSSTVDYKFSDAVIERPSKYVIIFKLKDSYSPFLTTVSRPIFKRGFVGLNNYKIKNVSLNGSFVKSIELVSARGPYSVKTYKFYPSSDSLKTSFLLGEVTKAVGLSDDMFRTAEFKHFPNLTEQKVVNYDQLVTLFFNTQDKELSSRDIRNGLTYALPDTFTEGKRSYTFFPPQSWAHSPQYLYAQDTPHAKQLTEDLRSSSQSAVLQIKTLPKYLKTAEIVANAWQQIGLKTAIEVVDTIPTKFQIFLGEFSLPKDPDQYMIWHSGQENNITKYESKRIDKLLEDGRKTVSMESRKQIYADLQKYLLADSPAAFLYFPYDYTIIRK